jgi:hypothetical protein
MFNHLKDIDAALQRSRSPTSTLLCMEIGEALAVLCHYYNKITTMLFIYMNVMILNPHVKLSIFNTDS